MNKSFLFRLLAGLLIGLAGVSLHMLALFIADRVVPSFPSVHDVALNVLPRLDLFLVGELFFVASLIFFAIIFFRERPSDLPYLLAMLGLLYAARGVFLLLLPIGAPFDAPALDERFVFYPYASHAYFPGGHVGILFLMSRSIQHRLFRPMLLAATVLFGFGTMLTRAHYTVDVLGGLLLAYGVEAWSSRHLGWLLPARDPKRGAVVH